MIRAALKTLIACSLIGLLHLADAGASVAIPGGAYEPFYPVQGEEPFVVAPFEIDAAPVTNAEFLAFVRTSPEWRRGEAPAVFADARYLVHWAGPDELGAAGPDHPVTNVSWFAARAFCEADGGRLPTEAEWELVARADEDETDARRDPARQARLLALYGARGGALADVASGAPDAWGVHDLHGLVWEWVEDFDASLSMGDSRNDGDRDLQLYCGGASLGASDRSDYAAFMRHAYRSGLTASATGGGLGFRCAR